MKDEYRSTGCDLPPRAAHEEIASAADQSSAQRAEALERIQRMADDGAFDFGRLTELDN